MKKILLVAMVAFAFMACNQNGASVPSNDKKAVKAVTTEAVSLIGEAPASVDKSLQKAGFVQADNDFLKVAKRATGARVAQKFNEVAPVEVAYIYNLPENYNEMTNKEGEAYIKSLLAKGECLAIVQAMFVEDKLVALSTSVLAPIKDNINLLYTESSDGLFKQLPPVDGKLTMWQGVIGAKEEKSYTDHAQYVADIAAAQAIEAQEMGMTVKQNATTGEPEGFGFMCMWMNPSEEEQASMEEDDGFIGAMGEFAVVDYAYSRYIQ